MIHKLRNRFQFYLERLLLRGAHYRLLIIAAVIELDQPDTGSYQGTDQFRIQG